MEDVIGIGNAGLVLAAPFLPRLFRMLGYLDVMRFADEETHAKAVYLLEYMATGDDRITGRLDLNALLCGWPHDRLLLPSPSLGDVEKRLADQVVDAMGAHWQTPGGMSASNLRSRFLRRSGTLDMGTDTVVRIPGQSQDALLRELPWVYAETGTPWSGTLTVRWGDLS